VRLIECDLSPDFETVEYLQLGDLHIESPEFESQEVERAVSWVLGAENRMTAIVGDVFDVAIAGSPGGPHEAEMRVNEALYYAESLFAPLAREGRIACILSGNHEERITKTTGVDVSEILARMLGVPYARDGAVLKWRFGRRKGNGKPQVYHHYVAHGTGGGRTDGGKLNKLSWLSDIVLADIYSCGHIHKKYSFSDAYFVPDARNRKVPEIRRVYFSSGAWLSYGGYGQRKLYSPVDRGSPILRMYASEKHAEVVL